HLLRQEIGGISMLQNTKANVLKANQALPKHELVKFTWGNVSERDPDTGYIVIKPSGVNYDDLTENNMVVLDLDGQIIEGTYNPSSDTKTHLEVYKAYPQVKGICHVHSTYATAFAQAGRAIEAAGDVDVLLLDKTGTITLGNRQAQNFYPVGDYREKELAEAVQLASLADETPEGRSIVILAQERFHLQAQETITQELTFIPFSAKTRMSGVDYQGVEIRKGAADAIYQYVNKKKGSVSQQCHEIVEMIAKQGKTPLVVAKNNDIIGVVHLKDIIKDGVKEKFSDLRKMGIKTIMITGDNPLTAAAIAAEAGVDDFLAEATPEAKLSTIIDYQRKGHLVAMSGDGTNDAPALAQADVAVAMNTGTQAAKEAGNMVDLDSSPTKLIEIVKIGKQLLMTRGSLTTFSIANDIAKYFAIIPSLFINLYPELSALNIMHLHNANSAILSAVIYNAFIIIALIPLALKGVKYHEVPANKLLTRNLLIYGLGGIVLPFVAIKLIDMVIVFLQLV
ncbi:MAG: K(+)-transporting ATPase subunit B, partial [Erysipelotrichia bacterium]|nr:K(+)-transporting ATPase subunit B [Erysipelotrichia bacterium]